MPGEGANPPPFLVKGINITLCELLNNLQAQDEKALDLHVFVSPPAPSGGYAGIDHISNLYPGNVVLHMMDAPKLTERGKDLIAAPASLRKESAGACNPLYVR